ncbi:MAG: methionine biosynthesis protein MetW [Porticoccaceae bacterium]|nr:methionine biosynthesis protein MetW [Porticoccaceae bacterium]
MNHDIGFIKDWIEPQSRVLDLGCGDGSLLISLQEQLDILGYGLEIDADSIRSCVARGVNVIEQDLNKGLKNFADHSFDTVLMTQTLQALRYPHLVLDEILRIGSRCIVTFPNFGNWRTRAYLNFRGRMPVTKQLAYQWFDTPNIHFFTYADFEALCKERNINILHRQFLANGFPDKLLKSPWPNLFTEIAVYHLSR